MRGVGRGGAGRGGVGWGAVRWGGVRWGGAGRGGVGCGPGGRGRGCEDSQLVAQCFGNWHFVPIPLYRHASRQRSLALAAHPSHRALISMRSHARLARGRGKAKGKARCQVRAPLRFEIGTAHEPGGP